MASSPSIDTPASMMLSYIAPTEGRHMVTEAGKRAMRRYARKTVQVIFRLRKDADADIIARLSSVPNRTEYIRELVRRDVRGAGKD